LFDAILIKDNHLALVAQQEISPADSVRAAREFVAKLAAEYPTQDILVEIEVESLEQLDDVLRAGPDVVLLDNMRLEQLQAAVARRNELAAHVELEVSGGVSLDTVREIALTGVERISAGSLTHSARWLDVALDWIKPMAR
jgi:nicotinate-nucleotide pyrophosphorylase (carboxylating)